MNNFRWHGTLTGRFMDRKLNYSNEPKADPKKAIGINWGKADRMVDEQGNRILTMDYSEIEQRIMSYYEYEDSDVVTVYDTHGFTIGHMYYETAKYLYKDEIGKTITLYPSKYNGPEAKKRYEELQGE